MGMAASQARYLALTARKNNTEYAGQQINQQRTSLSNESANYNNQLLGLNVPTAPSVDSFTKITYTWETMDGTKSTINSIVPNTDPATSSTKNYVIDYSYSQVAVKADHQNNAGKLNVDELVYTGSGFKMGGIALEQLDNTNTVDANKIKTLSDEYAIAHKDDNNGAGATNDGVSTGQKWFSYTSVNENTGLKTINYYAENDLQNFNWPDANNDGQADPGSTANINRWNIGNETEMKQVDNEPVYIARSSNGQMTEITVGTSTYTLTTNTIQDSEAYDAATNKYEYEKAKYDKSIDDIDARIAIVQQQDRSLELKLKQLDTEQEAISTEMDAVKKVIDKNIESGFKTFA